MPSQDAFSLQMNELKRDMSEMRSAVTEMARAMSKLAILEERNLVANKAIEKIGNKVEKLEEKVTENEITQIVFETKVTGISKTMKFMWSAFGGGVLYLIAEVTPPLIHYFSK